MIRNGIRSNNIDIVVECELRSTQKVRTSEIDQLRNVGEFVELICTVSLTEIALITYGICVI